MILVDGSKLVQLMKDFESLEVARDQLLIELQRVRDSTDKEITKIKYDLHEMNAHFTTLNLKLFSIEEQLENINGSA